MKIPGIVAVVIGAIIVALSNYFSVGGLGYTWLYAPIALSVLGVVAKFFDVQSTPAAPVATARGLDGATVAPTSKTRRFLLG